MRTAIVLTDRQAARWTVIASYHFEQERLTREAGRLDQAQFHKDAYDFLKHIETEAIKAGLGAKNATCPLCDGKGAL